MINNKLDWAKPHSTFPLGSRISSWIASRISYKYPWVLYSPCLSYFLFSKYFIWATIIFYKPESRAIASCHSPTQHNKSWEWKGICLDQPPPPPHPTPTNTLRLLQATYNGKQEKPTNHNIGSKKYHSEVGPDSLYVAHGLPEASNRGRAGTAQP